MNLDELRSVQEAERSKSNLQELRDSFYEEAGKYIADLKAERQRIVDREDDPFSNPEFGRLSDEIDTAEDVVEAIYDRRLGKLLEEASLEAADMGGDVAGLTAEEQVLFDSVVDQIESNKTTVLETIAGNLDDGDDGGEEAEADPAPGHAGGQTSEGPERSASESRERSASDRGGRSTPDRGGDSTPDPPDHSTARGDAATPEGDGGSPDGRRAVEPGSPPPDGGAPGSEESVPAAGAMGGDPPDTGDSSGGDSHPASGEPKADGPVPTPPSPDELAGPAGGGSEPVGESVSQGATGTRSPEAVETASPVEGSAGASDSADVDRTEAIDERVMVRVTDDVGAIYGVDDREYDLERESVVTLPEENAEPLIERGAAERLE